MSSQVMGWLPMLRGEIYLADLEPVRGAETNRRRPVVVVSQDGLNTVVTRTRRGIVTVAPLTSNTARVYDFQVLLPADQTGLDRNSKVQVEQVRGLDASRIGPHLGEVPGRLMDAIDDALRLHLSLRPGRQT